MNNITAREWVEKLEQVSNSTVGKSGKKYLGSEFKILSSSERENRIPITEIITQSKEIIKKLDHSSNPHEAIDLTKRIHTATNQIIKDKLYGNKLEIGFNWLMAVITSVLGVGILLGIDLWNTVKEIKELQKSLNLETNKILEKISIKDLENINEQISSIPILVKQNKQSNEALKKSWNADIVKERQAAEEKGLPFLHIFTNDFGRSQKFLRHDSYKNINDIEPVPAYEVSAHQESSIHHKQQLERVQDASNLLKNLFSSELESKNWEFALQYVTSQAIHHSLFFNEYSLFDYNSVAVSDKFSIDNKKYHLRLVYPEHTAPPLSINVIRDESNQIKEIKCELKSSLDVEAYCLPPKDDPKSRIILKENAIEGSVQLTLALDSNQKAYVSNFERNVYSNI